LNKRSSNPPAGLEWKIIAIPAGKRRHWSCIAQGPCVSLHLQQMLRVPASGIVLYTLYWGSRGVRTGNCRLWRIPIWFMHSPLSIFAWLMFTPLNIRCSFITKSNTIRHKVNTFEGNLFHISSEHHICGFTESFPTNCAFINIFMCKLLPNQPLLLVP